MTNIKESKVTDSTAHHAKVKQEQHQGEPVTIKRFALNKYGATPAELMRLYLLYRTQVEQIYVIPFLRKAVLTDNYLTIEESTIPGTRLDHLARDGKADDWIQATRQLFMPLAGHLTGRQTSIGPYTSFFPLDTRVDIKPANIIVSVSGPEMQVIPVDFFPPLIINQDTGMFVHTRTPEETARVVFSYGDLEVLIAKHYFTTKAINPSLARSISAGLVQICNGLDHSGNLAERIANKALASNATCPNCPYCTLGSVDLNVIQKR